jgi:hypothetical protein
MPPTPPAPTVPDLSGAWRGTWVARHIGFAYTDAVAVTFTKTSTGVSGTVAGPGSPAAAAVELAVTAASQVQGTVKLTYAGACEVTATVSGTQGGTTLRFATQVVPMSSSPLCEWAPVNEFDLVR